jgi:hypothetical protein
VMRGAERLEEGGRSPNQITPILFDTIMHQDR